MICIDDAVVSRRLLAGSMKFHHRIMHYIICRVLLSRSSNLAQAIEEDLILMWALMTGRQINWAHLIRYRIKKALPINVSLPYPHLVTLFLEHFQIPLDNEPHVLIKRSFAIGPGVLYSFGYKKNRQGDWIRKKNAHIE